jgi:Zinc finger, C3HC4 type (RING finger)
MAVHSDTGPFSPADFEDAYDALPAGAAFDIGGNGSSTPYGNAINAIVTKQMEEIRSKTVSALALPGGWKKRFREFINKKNSDLVDFLQISVPNHPIMGPAEILLRRFGNPQVHSGHPSVKDFVIDSSGADHVPAINEAVDKARGQETGLKAHAIATQYIYDQYRQAGEEILVQQSLLKAKLEKLDRIQGRLSILFEIDMNEAHTQLLESVEVYLKKVFEENQISVEYGALITAYKRFITLRDTVQMMRSSAVESEPMCSICLADTVSYTMTPCGHTFCQNCVRRQGNSCPMCRTQIKERVRIYFG